MRPVPGYSVRLLAEQAVPDDSELIRLQARVGAVAQRLGFDAMLRERVRLVAAEMATNQAKYARGKGYIQAWEVSGAHAALDLFAFDWGPGIADLSTAMRDGHSSSGTLGKGLGAMSRLAQCFDIYSIPAQQRAGSWHGTVIWARFTADLPMIPAWERLGLYTRPYQDGRCNGDLVALFPEGRGGGSVLHIDALGHGCSAQEVAEVALAAFDPSLPPEKAIARLDRALAGGRGAALAVYRFDEDRASVLSVGAGDLQASILQATSRETIRLAAGVIGQVHGGLHVADWTWPFGSLLMSTSDGFRTSWELPPGLFRRHPQLIAYCAGQMAGRISDDKSLLLVRNLSGREGKHGTDST